MHNLIINRYRKRLAYLGILSFYFVNICILFIYNYSWGFGEGAVQDLLLFMPRWLFLLLLLPAFLCLSLIRKHALPLLAVLIFNFVFYINYNIPISAFSSAVTPSDFRVMSANIGGLKKKKEQLAEQIKYAKPNLIAFQETDKYKIQKILPSHWKIHCIDHKCLASEFEFSFIKKLSRRSFTGAGSYAVLYEVIIKGKRINVVNVHIETPRKGFEETLWRSFDYTPMYYNVAQRYKETRNISTLIENDNPTILLGDFNMPSESRIYSRYFSEYTNSFDNNGIGLGYTKYTKIHGIRIDHVLVSKKLLSTNVWVGSDFGGDHRAIFTDVSFN